MASEFLASMARIFSGELHEREHKFNDPTFFNLKIMAGAATNSQGRKCSDFMLLRLTLTAFGYYTHTKVVKRVS